MNLIKSPLAGEHVWHRVDLYCKNCRKVTPHDMHFMEWEGEEITASAFCQEQKKKKYVYESKWAVDEVEWVCKTYQVLVLTKDQWLRLISGTSSGGAHKRRL